MKKILEEGEQLSLAHRTRPVNGSGPLKPKFRLDNTESRCRHLSSVWSPIHLAHVTAMAQRPASARFQKQPRASTAFLPCFFGDISGAIM